MEQHRGNPGSQRPDPLRHLAAATGMTSDRLLRFLDGPIPGAIPPGPPPPSLRLGWPRKRNR